MLADLLQAFGAVLLFAWLTAGTTVAAGSEAQLRAEPGSLLAAVPEANVLALAVGAWQIAIVAYGLSETQDASAVQAAIAAAVVLVPVSLRVAL